MYTCIPHTHSYIHTRTLDQHHFQVQEIEKNKFCCNSFLQVFIGGSRTLKCCCYFFFLPIQKATCYHSNRTMLKMSILHST